MSKNKEKKTKKGFAPHAIRIGCVLLVLLLIVNVAANYFSRVLDVYVGLGEATITTKEGAETWDTEYYKLDSKTAEDADKSDAAEETQPDDQDAPVEVDADDLPE